MSRPVKPRRVRHLPRVTYFKPMGTPMHRLKETVMTVDELEALRLKDLEGIDQRRCADQMGVAQSTLQRILSSARKKLTGAIVGGNALRIEGGSYSISDRVTCKRCRHGWRRNVLYNERGRAGGGPRACPSCGYEYNEED